MTEQKEGSSKIANKAAKEFAKWSSTDYKQEVAGEFGGATVPTGFVAPNRLDEKTARKYSGSPTGKNSVNLEMSKELTGKQENSEALYTLMSKSFEPITPIGYAGTMGGATPASRMTQETAAEPNPETKFSPKKSKYTK